MDYEDIMNYTTVDSRTEPTTSVKDSWINRIEPHEVILFTCCTAAFFADLAIIFTMLCFKQLRTALNVFIVSWAILDICAVLVTPVGYRLVSILNHLNVCFLLQMGLVLHFLIIVSVFIIFISWCIIAYFSKFSKWIGVYYKITMALIWGILLIFLIILSTGCLGHKFNDNAGKGGYGTLALLLMSILTIRFLNVLRKNKEQSLEHSKLPLTLCTAFVLCHAFALGSYAMSQFLWLWNPIPIIISACFVYCNSVVTFSVLFFYDKPFQLHVRKIIHCTPRGTGRSFNEGERLDQEAFSEVSFHCPTEELRTNK
ncbi:hypothetical protein PPYR_12323 [Photinus pyralis]|uniref:G-protein coupled receptors family 1 profile domain-containing protein n=1 Tax=Photinus pyralis TaxID=7054 RepID=A0A5N4ADU1_PHOPY|nr:uncharacterized protein LOC116175991 [Photinus pyralis]KAB0795484.1 hypothetical protein PPYR_12323 [Photinus pyralis]